MKKLISLLLSVLMCLSLFGCSKPAEEEESTLIFEISTLFVVPALEATQVVEDEMNRYLKEDLKQNFKIKLKVTSIGDYLTNVPMEVQGGGEDCPDIVQVFSLASDVDNGYLVNLDQYLDKELKGTKELIGNVIGSGKVGGSFYMIPRFFGTVLDWKWIYNVDYVNQAGVDASKVNSLQTLYDACLQMKQKFPKDYFIVYTDQFPIMMNNETHTSLIGTYGATVGSSTEIVNYYRTESYKEAIKLARQFRAAGLADPEGSQNTASHDTVVMSGASKGVIMGHSAECQAIADMFTNTNTYGATFGATTIGISDLATDTLGVGITYKCKNPSAAAKFIDLLYTDEYLWKTLIYGKEGQDYVWDEKHEFVDYPAGLDFNTIPYNLQYSCGMIGNGFQSLPFKAATDSGSNPEYGKELMGKAWCPPLYGFTPTVGNVANEVAAVSNVVDQYNKSLTFGDLENWEATYNDFIKALDDAGIEKIIADFNTQAKAWLG